MSDLVLRPTRPTITITITEDDGSTHDHSFEVLPLTKPRFDMAVRFGKRVDEMVADNATANEEYAALMTEFCDELVRSTNGPVTISGLWADGLLPFPWVKRVAEYVKQEAAGDPPA